MDKKTKYTSKKNRYRAGKKIKELKKNPLALTYKKAKILKAKASKKYKEIDARVLKEAGYLHSDIKSAYQNSENKNEVIGAAILVADTLKTTGNITIDVPKKAGKSIQQMRQEIKFKREHKSLKKDIKSLKKGDDSLVKWNTFIDKNDPIEKASKLTYEQRKALAKRIKRSDFNYNEYKKKSAKRKHSNTYYEAKEIVKINKEINKIEKKSQKKIEKKESKKLRNKQLSRERRKLLITTLTDPSNAGNHIKTYAKDRFVGALKDIGANLTKKAGKLVLKLLVGLLAAGAPVLLICTCIVVVVGAIENSIFGIFLPSNKGSESALENRKILYTVLELYEDKLDELSIIEGENKSYTYYHSFLSAYVPNIEDVFLAYAARQTLENEEPYKNNDENKKLLTTVFNQLNKNSIKIEEIITKKSIAVEKLVPIEKVVEKEPEKIVKKKKSEIDFTDIKISNDEVVFYVGENILDVYQERLLESFKIYDKTGYDISEYYEILLQTTVCETCKKSHYVLDETHILSNHSLRVRYKHVDDKKHTVVNVPYVVKKISEKPKEDDGTEIVIEWKKVIEYEILEEKTINTIIRIYNYDVDDYSDIYKESKDSLQSKFPYKKSQFEIFKELSDGDFSLSDIYNYKDVSINAKKLIGTKYVEAPGKDTYNYASFIYRNYLKAGIVLPCNISEILKFISSHSKNTTYEKCNVSDLVIYSNSGDLKKPEDVIAVGIFVDSFNIVVIDPTNGVTLQKYDTYKKDSKKIFATFN